MSRTSDAANAMVYAAEKVCGLYGVQFTREQSRTINVEGTAGRWRPMFFGMWTDGFGKIHRAGKADVLARPRVRLAAVALANRWDIGQDAPATMYTTVPLWIECKTGAGRLKPDQIAFKNWVESNGDFYLLLHDDVRPLMEWFEERGVEKYSVEGALRAVQSHIPATDLYVLPCKHCSGLRPEHIGPAFGCKLRKGKAPKVWSPDLGAAKA